MLNGLFRREILMKRAIVLLLALCMFGLFGYGCDDNTNTGDICSESVSNVANTREARLYYPCTINGTVGATTMSSGYTGTYGDVEWLSEAVVEAGFVVLAFTPTSEWGMVSGWRDAHKSCIAKLKDINNSHSVLKGKIDTGKLSTCGHSKGGGGSLWASSQLQGELRTTIGMAPYSEGFADSALNSVTAATFIQAGASDTLATNSMTRGEYSGLGNISKKYAEYTGYDHLAWANATGSKADRLSSDIIAWMKYYMNGDNSQAETIADQSGTGRFEWVDKGNDGGSYNDDDGSDNDDNPIGCN